MTDKNQDELEKKSKSLKNRRLGKKNDEAAVFII